MADYEYPITHWILTQMTHWYELSPFASNASANKTHYSVQASAACNGVILLLQFKVDDPLNQIDWHEQQHLEQRDYLWENTCFEAFISAPDQNSYFELNLSPSLAWNLYQFSNYRTPNTMPPQRVTAAKLVKFEVVDKTIRVEIDLTRLKLVHQDLRIGMTAVIKTAEKLEYLAIHHPKSEADFHDSKGWTIRLLPDAQIPESNVDNKAKNP